MIISLSAAPADFSQFIWYVNKGAAFKFDPGNGQHVMRVDSGDLIGIKKTTRGPTAGSYQAVLEKYPHLIFRSVPGASIEKHLSDLKPYNGIPAKPEKTGQRYTKVKIKGADAHDKLTALKYKPEAKFKESGEYDRENYQWREVVNGPIPIRTKEHGKTRQSLKNGDIIGVRFVTSAKGGYVILPSGERLNISEENYESVISGARILPSSGQQVGVVILNDLNLPKRTRVVKPKASTIVDSNKPLEFEDDDLDNDAAAKRGQHFIKQHSDLVSDFDYEEDDDSDDFEDEFEDDFEDDDEESESEESVNNESEDVHYIEEGMILKMPNGSRFVVASVMESGLNDTVILYNQESSTIRTTKIPAGLDVRELPGGVVVDGSITGTELTNIQRRVNKLANRKG